MISLDIAHARAFAQDAARAVAAPLTAGFGKTNVDSFKNQRPFDAVTELDTGTENWLHELLSRFDAGIGFRGEESGASGNEETFWLVDPIDGTGLFTRGIPMCTTMIALVDRGEVVVGVINDFVKDELFSAGLGQGATCNGHELHMQDCPLQMSYVPYEINVQVGDNLDLFRRLNKATWLMDVMNCGYAYASTAANRFNARITKDGWGFDWDYAPGCLLVSEAGGIVRNIGTDSFDYRDHNIIAANPLAYKELVDGPDALFPLDSDARVI